MYREVCVSMSGGSSLNGVFQGAFVINGERTKIIIFSLLRPTWLSYESCNVKLQGMERTLKVDDWACLYEEINVYAGLKCDGSYPCKRKEWEAFSWRK